MGPRYRPKSILVYFAGGCFNSRFRANSKQTVKQPTWRTQCPVPLSEVAKLPPPWLGIGRRDMRLVYDGGSPDPMGVVADAGLSDLHGQSRIEEGE
jgi:hypothetical protein